MRKEILRASHLYKRVGNVLILNDFSMNLYEGEVLGIMGLRDSGKTLLFHILSGEEEFDAGTLFFDEQKLEGNKLQLRNKIALVKKESALEKNMTVTDNIFHIRKHYHHQFWVHERLYRSQAKEQLERVSLAIDPDSPVSELSEIECYMIEILKGYIMGARIIILDDFAQEHTKTEYFQLNALIEKLREQGVSFLVAGYQMQNLQIYSERILFLVNGTTGKIVCNKRRKQINENLVFQTAPAEKKKKREIIRENKTEVFRAEGICTPELQDISFSLYQGEVLTLVDLSNSKNQSLFDCLMHQEQVISGDFYYRKHCLTKKSRFIKRGEILFVDFNSQNKIIEPLSLQDNLCIGNFHKVSAAGFYSRKSMNYIERDFLAWYPSEALINRKNCFHLSEKDKMAIVLYRMRLQRPKMMICVNPDRYTDAQTYLMVQQQLQEMAQTGTSILILSANVERSYQLTDRFLFWENGRLKESNFIDEIVE